MGAIPLGPTGYIPWRQGDRERTPKTGNRHLPARAEGAESARLWRGGRSARAIGSAWIDSFGFPQSSSPSPLKGIVPGFRPVASGVHKSASAFTKLPLATGLKPGPLIPRRR